MPFEACCPGVKYPGDDCPPVWGKVANIIYINMNLQCSHAMHMQCIMKWLESQQNIRQECPVSIFPIVFYRLISILT